MDEAVNTLPDDSVRPKALPLTKDLTAVRNQDDTESNISSETEGPDTHSMVSSSGETGGPDSDSFLRCVSHIILRHL